MKWVYIERSCDKHTLLTGNYRAVFVSGASILKNVRIGNDQAKSFETIDHSQRPENFAR